MPVEPEEECQPECVGRGNSGVRSNLGRGGVGGERVTRGHTLLQLQVQGGGGAAPTAANPELTEAATFWSRGRKEEKLQAVIQLAMLMAGGGGGGCVWLRHSGGLEGKEAGVVVVVPVPAAV